MKMPSSKVISYIFFFFLILEINNKSRFLSLILIRGNLLKSSCLDFIGNLREKLW